MAEIEITLPTVQYGNVKLRATPEELGIPDISNADQLGIVTAIYLNLFTQGFKTGAQMDVSAPQAAPQGDPAGEAQDLLDKGLGGVTEVHEDSTAEISDDGQNNDAPWNSTVDAKPKPWETEKQATPKVATINW